MGIFDSIFGNEEDTRKETKDVNQRLQLRQEVLDINKASVHKGDVELGKEIISEQKSVDVPVSREEVVIERKALNNEPSDAPITNEETIRIPVSEETVNVNKHTVVTGEVSAHKRSITDTKHIDETLKREEAMVNKTGNAEVVDNATENDVE